MVLAVLACLALAAGAVACGDDEEDAGAGSGSAAQQGDGGGEEPVRIAYLLATQAAGYPQGMLQAAEQAAQRAGAELQVFDAQFDPQRQVSQCQDAVTSGRFDAIVALPAASPPMIACARAAAQQDIPLIATNTPIGTDLASPTSDVPGVTSQVLVPALTAFGAEPGGGAHDLLTGMCEAVEGPCRIGFIQGVAALALTAAADRNVKRLARENGWELVGTCEGNYQRQGGLQCMQDLLQRAPDMNVLMSQSDDMALGAERAMRARGKTPGEDILVGTQGGSVAGIENIKSGRWFGSILSLAEPEGRIPIELAVRAARGEQVPRSVDPNEATGMPLVLDQRNKDEFPDFEGQFEA
jgi:ribose transport system substrate-binding protein